MCIQDRTLLGQTGLHITNGELTREIGRSKFRPRCKVFRVMREWGSTSIGILLLGMSACSPLGSMIIESEMSDLQLTMDTLKASLQDAQRTAAELRAEVDARRLELADVQIARAQLDGRIREVERRLTEARHVIDLQRAELAYSRSKRERIARTGVSLQNQRKHLYQNSSKLEKPAKVEISEAIAPGNGEPELATVHHEQKALTDDSRESTQVPSQSAMGFDTSMVGEGQDSSQSSTMTTRLRVLIKTGDTLWSLAQRHRTSVKRLMTINALSNDRIRVGQMLWLTELSAGESEHERM
jgi:LysM repeat protein